MTDATVNQHKIMLDESLRMQRLVEDLISLSRIEAEKYRPPDGEVDLADAPRRAVPEDLRQDADLEPPVRRDADLAISAGRALGGGRAGRCAS